MFFLVWVNMAFFKICAYHCRLKIHITKLKLKSWGIATSHEFGIVIDKAVTAFFCNLWGHFKQNVCAH